MKRFLLWLIRGYRKNISPARPNCCRFIPTCSAYAMEAIEVHGAIKGGWLALKRLLKCHPFHRQTSFVYDPVPRPNGSAPARGTPHPYGGKAADGCADDPPGTP